ncbi:hypothetical protein [Leifsonia sp. NPDC058230]|uniref:hypothetical protein n=1 Tax=Leifsonia sp. NPDC058230 TaxID=3346391 RepID=UPI0036DF5349
MDTKRVRLLAAVWLTAALVFVAAVVTTFQAAGGAMLGQILQPWLIISATVAVLLAVVASMVVAIRH